MLTLESIDCTMKFLRTDTYTIYSRVEVLSKGVRIIAFLSGG